jgi:hypothetical protein
MRRRILLTFVILSALGSSATAATLEVPSVYPTIQDAIDAAALSGDDINVAPGHYTGVIDFHGKEIDLHSADVNDPSQTWLDGWWWDSVVTFENCGPGAKLRGFNIFNGYAHAGSGGGIKCVDSSPTITNCIIEWNSADFYGGGIDIDGAFPGSDPVIRDCIIRNNSAAYGGAISTFWFNSPQISFCEITHNTASDVGGYGILPVGGGMHCQDSSPVFKSCLITNNTAQNIAGAMYLYEANAEISNCTIANNVGHNDYGGIYCDSREYRQPTVKNSILWNNGDDLYNCDGLVKYSCLEDFDLEPTNIHQDPLFVGPYYLSFDGGHNIGQEVNSPCIDAGDNSAADLGLDQYTTRSDHAADTGPVDLGYHQEIILPVPDYNLVRCRRRRLG